MTKSASDAYTNIDDFLEKASMEGGIAGGIEYGLSAEEHLTEEAKQANPEFVKLWDGAAEAWGKLEVFVAANFEME